MKRVLLTLLMLAACHHGTRKVLTPDVPTTGSAEARSRFQDAKARFLNGSEGGEFKQIVRDFPNDPIVPWAELYAGIAAVKARNFPEADAQLGKVIDAHANEALTTRAQLFLGIAKNYEGDTASARTLLRDTGKAVENDDERTEYLAAVAFSTAAGDKPLAALPAFDELFGRVTPAERAVIVQRIEEVVAAADPDALRRSFDELGDRKGPSVAIVGTRLALIADASGDAAGAAKLRESIGPARAAAGLPRTITETEVPVAAGAGDPGLVGAVLPGSKKEARLTDAVVAGLGLAGGAPDGKGVAAIETRTAADKTGAAEAVDELARHNVIAVVGPIESASVDSAGERAEGLGVPLISLATQAEKRRGGRFVFHIRHSPDARARTLAKAALAKGVTTFAVLAPETPYGTGVVAAFTDAVQKGGGKIVAKVTYPPDTKSFADKAAKLTGAWDGVFVADDATHLSLIAPALAATGTIPKPVTTGKKKKLPGGRPVLLLSTAEDLTAEYLTNAGRHSEGALLAPGFYPDDADPLEKPFIDRYVAAYGRPPTATAAYAYDAAQLAAAAGQGGRSGLAATLARSQLPGVTGAIQFDAEHRRADPGVLYTVVEETGGTWAIRVAH